MSSKRLEPFARHQHPAHLRENTTGQETGQRANERTTDRRKVTGRPTAPSVRGRTKTHSEGRDNPTRPDPLRLRSWTRPDQLDRSVRTLRPTDQTAPRRASPSPWPDDVQQTVNDPGDTDRRPPVPRSRRGHHHTRAQASPPPQ